MTEFTYREMFPLGPDTTEYRRLTSDFVSDASFEGHAIDCFRGPDPAGGAGF